MYDYLLVVGPGRSGSEFLYRALNAHPEFAFPEIKEGIYYRSPRAFRRARRKLQNERHVLCDIANGAYRDPALVQDIERLQTEGFAVLVMVLIRDYRARAVSMMRFRKSRGEPSALLGARYLERAAVRDRLTAEALENIYGLNVDILTVSFSVLTRETAAMLGVLASVCGTAPFAAVPKAVVNESKQPRLVWLSAGGRACGVLLRKLGFRRLLQRIKDDERVQRMFFAPLPRNREVVHLSEESIRILEASNRACCALVENRSETIRAGVYFRKART